MGHVWHKVVPFSVVLASEIFGGHNLPNTYLSLLAKIKCRRPWVQAYLVEI